MTTSRLELMKRYTPHDLICRLCKALHVNDVLRDTGLRAHEIDNILEAVRVPVPRLKSKFPRFEKDIMANIERHQSYLDRTVQLRAMLADAQDELQDSYVRFDF